MNGETAGPLSMLTGIVGVRLAAGDAYLSFVKPSMRWPLLLGGAVMVILGFSVWLRAFRQGSRADHVEDEHDHLPRVAWLLALPAMMALLVPPNALDADAATRRDAFVPADAGWVFSPLPERVDGAVDMSLSELSNRALFDDPAKLEDVPLRLTGFVVPEGGSSFLLTRFVIACCAADGAPVQVRVRTEQVLETNSWVEVIATLARAPRDDGDIPIVVSADRLTPIEAPDHPYE